MPHSPHPFILGLLAIAATVLAWAIFTTSSTGGDPEAAGAGPLLEHFNSVAYIEPGGNLDSLYIRNARPGAVPELVEQFSYRLAGHARGSAAPTGDRIAVLSVGDQPAGSAQLTVISLPGRERSDYGLPIDYLSPMAWDANGKRLALVRTDATESTKARRTIVQVEPDTRTVVDVARFDATFSVAPVGYSHDGRELFAVVVDSSGSALWAIREGRTTRLATLSPGPTQDWRLSADGSRLAFVERLGVGERRYAGRTLMIGTGAIEDAPGSGDQVGATWSVGAVTPEFGGPGGTVLLRGGEPGTYLVPLQRSPDGTTLVAAVYDANDSASAGSTEILTTDSRQAISGTASAKFIGWVRDID
ncbi:MAG: hypothetical protein HYX53_04115 [Chloroflexi bacterium]|nr:hypothetical protein [Chloroflexota bacterium]